MIPLIRSVLYATDLSSNSAYVFRYAINTAKKHNTKIHILNVIETQPTTEVALMLYESHKEIKQLYEEKKEIIVQKVRDRLEEFAKLELFEDPEIFDYVSSIIVVVGDPASEILKHADKLNSDVIIMGNHSKGLISYTFLGSVAERVLRRSRRPVYIIPIPAGEES